ncbi:hypothetical protein [Prochlorococcus sp. MIT 1227]|uniref:hypothetical protein n=1 Tax=Prochlorococcus sp. MIT 1227 TaxID=3082536 RepID=UPI0039A51CE6
MPFTVQPLCMVVRDQMACLQGIQRAWETHLQTKRLPAPPYKQQMFCRLRLRGLPARSL